MKPLLPVVRQSVVVLTDSPRQYVPVRAVVAQVRRVRPGTKRSDIEDCLSTLHEYGQVTYLPKYPAVVSYDGVIVIEPATSTKGALLFEGGHSVHRLDADVPGKHVERAELPAPRPTTD
jgi:hypothetical protein